MTNTSPDLQELIDAIKPKEAFIGMTSDDLLDLYPKSTMVGVEVVGYDAEVEGFIVLWKYKDFSCKLERVVNDQFPLGIYAVQEIVRHESEENNSPSDD